MIMNMLTNQIKSMMSNTRVIYLFRYGVTDIFFNDNRIEFVNLIAEDFYEKNWRAKTYYITIPSPGQWISRKT